MTRTSLALLAGLLLCGPVAAQPTYKLDVKPELRPRAFLSLSGKQVARTTLSDDPGFRLQYHFKKAGKTVAVVEARSADKVNLPSVEPGVYTVALELFYPAYKGGTAQKGEFRAVSPVIAYRVVAGNPPSIVVLPLPPSPALEALFGTRYPRLPEK
jgi:hypothetical protein